MKTLFWALPASTESRITFHLWERRIVTFYRLLPALILLLPGIFQKPAQAQTGIITTLAGATPVGGAPVRGYGGDGGPAVNATLALANLQNTCLDNNKLEQMDHISVDASGNVYFPDANNQRIRRISPDGTITTIAGTGSAPQQNSRCEATSPVGDGGPAVAATLFNPADVQVMPNGNLVIADQQNNRIRQITPDGKINTIVGMGMHNPYAEGASALNSPMDWPSSVAFDANGTLYFAEIHTHRVGKVASDGKLVTVAGTGFPGYSGDNGPATKAQLRNPAGIALDAQGNLYIADQGNHRIRKVTPNGTISTFAGNGTPGYLSDNVPATSTSLNFPCDVKVDAKGNVYIADTVNNRIRRVSPDGIISTIAGNGQQGRGPDNVPAVSSSLNYPSGIAIDGNGSVYIIDWQNYLIRKVTFTSQPSITPGGVVNGASFAPAPIPVAPGSIISIFGVNLATSTASASQTPLPTQLAGTSVMVNGAPIPLFFVSPNQINAQLPFEVPAGTAKAVVANAAGTSGPETFHVASSNVGIFQYPESNAAVALNQDGSLNGPNNPEARGNVIVVFLTGQGPVSPPVPTGQAAPLDPLSRATLSFGANIGGVAAPVQFLGLTPGFVGLAQANIQIPASVTPGNSVVMYVIVDGQAGNTATISVK
jgi:uncharacterized protein (TIGR03437 family)